MKIVVFDDDPTGSQTVHSCPLLLRWDQESLVDALKNSSPLLFLLANTRSLSSELAAARTRDMCQSVSQALVTAGFLLEETLIVSRGDSTLRGHGVVEPEVINEELGPFDATFHVPAFFEGGRTTVDGVHLLNGVPVHTTPFAQDQVFGYTTSNLDLWLEEKSRGLILAENVVRLTIPALDAAFDSSIGMSCLIEWLLNLSGNQSVVVDAELPSQLVALAQAVRTLVGHKRFLFRSAASLINGLAMLPSKAIRSGELSCLRLKAKSGQLKPGLVTVGSYVPLADEQLAMLLMQNGCEGVELPAEKIANVIEEDFPQQIIFDLENQLVVQLRDLLISGKTPVLYSSRGELRLSSFSARIKFGIALAELMARLVANVIDEVGYVISKGGTTTHILLQKGLNLDSVQLKGQLLPGLSLVCAENYFLAEGLPIITFPGNLGDKTTLLVAWRLMENK